jgi:hypothetical protein
VSPSESIKDRTDCWPAGLGPFIWPHTSSWLSLNSAIPYMKRQSRTRSGEMARVARTLLATDRLKGGGVLSSGADLFMWWRIRGNGRHVQKS